MTTAHTSATASLSQLALARQFALQMATHYPQIIEGVLPAIGAQGGLEQRRWGSDFLAETLATPELSGDQKQRLSLLVLPVLKDYLDRPGEDIAVVKSAVLLATSVYQLVFKHTIYNPQDGATWQKIAGIKSNILRRMDASPLGIKICCIKFIQRVVQVQTPGLIADPRRPEENELSLAMVPPSHPLIAPPTLEAEAFGLLDRLLNVFHDDGNDALLVTATMNSIGVLVRTRPSVANRILNAILNFNPFKIASQPMNARSKVAVKSMERTIKAFLVNLNKGNPNHPMVSRVQAYLDRLQRMRLDMMDESRKRPAMSEPTDGLDSVKRQRLDADVSDTPPPTLAQPPTSAYPPLPAGPVTLAQLFTLTQDEAHKAYDVTLIPKPLLNKIVVPILSSIGQTQLSNALNAVRAKYLTLAQPQLPIAPNTLQAAYAQQFAYSTDDATVLAPEVSLGTFTMPQPPPLTSDQIDEYGQATVNRVVNVFGSLEVSTAAKNTLLGFQRLAASTNDRDSWVTVVARLATRVTSGLEVDQQPSKIKQEGKEELDNPRIGFSMATTIRDALHFHVLEDFRRRIDVAICWLNEEWYNDCLQRQAAADEETTPPQHYQRLCLKLLDGLLTYLDGKDRFIIRFMSELPDIDVAIVERIKRLAHDPDRVALAVQTLQFLILYRPPVRDICLDAIEDLWKTNDSAKAIVGPFLTKWRPQVVQSSTAATRDLKSPTPVKSAITT